MMTYSTRPLSPSKVMWSPERIVSPLEYMGSAVDILSVLEIRIVP